LAGLVVAPFIITWASPAPPDFQWNSKSLIEAVFCGAGLVAGTVISFNSWFVYGIQCYPLAYLPFPFLFWGALRFGQRGATTGTLLVSALAIYSLLHRRGPFVADTEVDSLMLIGSYIGTLAVTNLLLAAAGAARRKAERERAKSESQARTLFGLIPVCGWCKNIRTDKDYWQSVEQYVSSHTNATFTHGICPSCAAKVGDAAPQPTERS
jgi:integral membrane sensor domain MASE1